MNCEKCIVRSVFNDGPCDNCKVKSASKISTVKQEQNKVPAWLSLYQFQLGQSLENPKVDYLSAERNENNYFDNTGRQLSASIENKEPSWLSLYAFQLGDFRK